MISPNSVAIRFWIGFRLVVLHQQVHARLQHFEGEGILRPTAKKTSRLPGGERDCFEQLAGLRIATLASSASKDAMQVGGGFLRPYLVRRRLFQPFMEPSREPHGGLDHIFFFFFLCHINALVC